MVSLLHCRRRRIVQALACVCLLVFASSAGAAQEKKMEIHELVWRHLESIGKASARGAIKSRFAAGTVKYVSRIGGGGNLEGTIGFVSLNPKTRYSIKFANLQNPGEQLAFDGKKLEVGAQPQGRWSDLALFIQQQDLPIKEGLLGGVLSTAWPLLKEPIPARLEYKGTKKIDGRTLHLVAYHPQKGSPELKVTLFFDPDTFRHVRTEYEFQIGARMGIGPNQSTKIQESRYLLSEDFEDFRTLDAVTIPYKCKLQLTVQASLRNILLDWSLSLDQIVHNQAVEENVFSLK
jgi:hypothetical protein